MSVAGCSTPTQSSKRGLSSQLVDQKPETSTTMIAATQEAASVSNLEGNAQDNNMAFDLNTYQWKNRLLLVFAPSENSPAYQRQMQLFQGQQAGFKERDLLLVDLLTESTSRVYRQALNDTDVARARSRFNVAPQDFRVILVGKDGTAKRRESNPIQPEVIFNEIDAMPMRQREMREQSRG
jgi:hypothetical protein